MATAEAAPCACPRTVAAWRALTLRDQIRLSTANRLAAIVVEADSGHRGQRRAASVLLPALAQVAHEHGALLVVDEMITGFGQTGDLWASTAAGVVPDIVTFKGVAAGFPLSGLITRPELAASRPWADPSHSSSSFGGNPLACAAANATTRIIIDENLSENAAGRRAALCQTDRAACALRLLVGTARAGTDAGI